MQVELKANGKTVQVELSEEQLKELGLVEDKPKTGYERGEECNDEYYYLVDMDSEVQRIKNTYSALDRDSYDTGNYYSDEQIAKNNARADRLLRRLRQWQAQNDRVVNWKDKNTKYTISYDYTQNTVDATQSCSVRRLNDVYFTTIETVEKAIEQFKDELIWYFTEYVQRLDEVQDND